MSLPISVKFCLLNTSGACAVTQNIYHLMDVMIPTFPAEIVLVLHVLHICEGTTQLLEPNGRQYQFRNSIMSQPLPYGFPWEPSAK
jgi:hypothetical protein